METRPPEIMERIVRHLVPPVSREHVVGDLSERYVAPGRYLFDVLRTVPFVIASQIRRTQHPVAILFFSVLLWFACFYGNTQAHWLVATIPTFAGIAALVLRDVYRTAEGFTRARVAALDIGVYAALVAVSQGIVALAAPELLLSKAALMVGFPLSCVVLFLVRLQGPSPGPVPKAARSISLQELTQEVRTYERVGKRAMRIEIGVAIPLAPVFIILIFVAPQLIVKIGAACVVAGVLFVTGFLLWIGWKRRPMPEHLDFAQSLAFYRASLQGALELTRTYLWWYILPLAFGPAVMTVGGALQRGGPKRALITLAVMVFFYWLLAKLSTVRRRGIQKRLDELAMVEQKP